MKALDTLLQEGVGTVYTAASVEIRLRGGVIYRNAVGKPDPEAKREGDYSHTQTDTLFDLASLTKLFTTSAFFRLVDSGRVRVDDLVCSLLPEFSGPRSIRPYPNPLVAGEQIEVVPPTDEI